MLNDGFAASERSRNAGSSALCYREKCVYTALTCNHRLDRRELFGIRSGNTHRPFLNKCYILNGAVVVFNLSYTVGNRIVSGAKLDYCSALVRRYHYFMCNNFGFLDGSVDVARRNPVAEFKCGFKVPCFIALKCRFVNSLRDI